MRKTDPVEKNFPDRGLPKGIYKCGKRFRASVWESGGAVVWQKFYDTVDEAEFMRTIFIHGHHWEGMPREPEKKAFGFIYRITCKETNRQYIGSKQFYHWAGPPGGFKCTDPTDEDWWSEDAWKDSGWKTYTGSSEELNNEIAFNEIHEYRFEVIALCKNKLALHMAEIMVMVEEDVLEALDENGNYKYFNKNIGGKEYRAPFKKADMRDKQEASLKHLYNYYLRPKMCCNAVVPYGYSECPTCRRSVI